MEGKAEIGIIGGSGFYSLLESPRQLEGASRYGKPSAPLALGKLEGRSVAFLPRHGYKHTIPPHKVPYRANIEAMANAGVKRLIATSAVGSLSADYKPGELVFFDQFVSMTHGRADTFFDEDTVVHVSSADPYCPELRRVAIKVAKRMGVGFHDKGTVVVINGPRFSSRAESRFFSAQGFELINMTQYPEVVLARERQICYLGIGMVTDYDAGLVGKKGIKPVSIAEVNRIFGENIGKVKELIGKLLPEIPEKRNCTCGSALEGAVATQK
jgi:5'-methylthioadenosine phosphorylase